MKKIILSLVLGLSFSACNKPTLPQILTAIQDSLNEAHSVEWLNEEEYTFASDAVSLAQAFAIKDTPKEEKKAAVVKTLIDSEMKIPPGSKVRPYFDWAIRLIPLL